MIIGNPQTSRFVLVSSLRERWTGFPVRSPDKVVRLRLGGGDDVVDVVVADDVTPKTQPHNNGQPTTIDRLGDDDD